MSRARARLIEENRYIYILAGIPGVARVSALRAHRAATRSRSRFFFFGNHGNDFFFFDFQIFYWPKTFPG